MVWERQVGWLRLASIAAFVGWSIGAGVCVAQSARSMFMTYSADQGLPSLGGTCMMQDHAGRMILCSEHGIYIYDGRRFLNLGPRQGLRDGKLVTGVASTDDGRIAVGYLDALFLSDQPSDDLHQPVSLTFHAVAGSKTQDIDLKSHRLVRWGDGFAYLIDDHVVDIVVPRSGAAWVKDVPFSPAERVQLSHPVAIFAVRGRLWEAFDDNRLCLAEPDDVRCFSDRDGLTGGPWTDVVEGSDNTILARSETGVATLDPVSSRWSVTTLPDQGQQYLSYQWELQLERTRDGSVITQSAHGLAIERAGRWQEITVDQGVPSGTIVHFLSDATGEIWMKVIGKGLTRWLSYGKWQTLPSSHGLSDSIPWQTERDDTGRLWVATDTSISRVITAVPMRVGENIPIGSYALCRDRYGRLWASNSRFGVAVIDTKTLTVTRIESPPVNVIVSEADGSMLLGTAHGLYRIADWPGTGPVPIAARLNSGLVTDVVNDGSGGVFYISGKNIFHRMPDGRHELVVDGWPTDGFQPLSLSIDHAARLWIGGLGGLFWKSLRSPDGQGLHPVPVDDIRTNAVVSTMVDHRGWLWIGTGLGVSVFDGHRWISVGSSGGLLDDDVSERGLREDPDGSVWISTSQGLSHLLQPDTLFRTEPLKATISVAEIGSRLLSGPQRYTTDPVSISLGTPNYSAEQSLQFRYRLSGVDKNWATTSTGAIRYPFVPPGHHVFTAVAYDDMTHRESSPIHLDVQIAYPWWRQGWAEALWGALLTGTVYGVVRLRFVSMRRRQAELERRVAEATEEMRAAQAQLRYQAAHDTLTGLLTRAEVERRLAETLSYVLSTGEIVVALLDIDHFKQINDAHGHLGGDDVLRTMGQLSRNVLRDGESAGRYGGEEILLLLDDSDGRGADRILALHAQIRVEEFKAARRCIRVTCSIGIAWAEPGDDWESLIGRADTALYEAKSTGRDRVVESRNAEAMILDAPKAPSPPHRAGEPRSVAPGPREAESPKA